MGKPNFSDDFKRDAVHQIALRGYPVLHSATSRKKTGRSFAGGRAGT